MTCPANEDTISRRLEVIELTPRERAREKQLRRRLQDECDLPDDLPELTDDERAALESIPGDAVSHWWNGEKWDFKKKVWIVDGD